MQTLRASPARTALGDFLTNDRFQALLAEASPSWLTLDPGDVRDHYNRRGFLVRHRLAEHPLFALDPLFALCRRLPPKQVHHRYGVVPVDSHFDSSLERHRADLTLDEAVEQLEEKGAYIAIYNPERDPEYRQAIDGFLGELAAATSEVVNWYSTYIFISAAASVTPYHMDREMNFLMQVRGTKQVKLWDPNDDEVMSPEQRDYLFSGAEDSRPTYHTGLEAKARVFELAPGLGVHHPFIAPHLVTTGPDLSISLAITFRTARSDTWSDAHRFNRQLRRLGLRPGRVGRSHSVDRAKAAIFRAARGASRLLRGRP